MSTSGGPISLGSLGFTHEFNSGGNPTRLDFSYGIGGGVNLLERLNRRR